MDTNIEPTSAVLSALADEITEGIPSLEGCFAAEEWAKAAPVVYAIYAVGLVLRDMADTVKGVEDGEQRETSTCTHAYHALLAQLTEPSN